MALNGKEFARKFERAEVLYAGANYAEALAIYLELFKADSLNANISYKIGSCYLKNGKQHVKAIYYLQKAVLAASRDYIENDRKESRAPLRAYSCWPMHAISAMILTQLF
jgi:tetratricopeptide (TPR) repeat protein